MRQKWSHGVGGYVFGKGRTKDVGRQERDGVGDCGSAVGFDFNVLTALIRLGRAGREADGCPPYYYYLNLRTGCPPYYYLNLRAGCPSDYYFKVERLYFALKPKNKIIFNGENHYGPYGFESGTRKFYR